MTLAAGCQAREKGTERACTAKRHNSRIWYSVQDKKKRQKYVVVTPYWRQDCISPLHSLSMITKVNSKLRASLW